MLLLERKLASIYYVPNVRTLEMKLENRICEHHWQHLGMSLNVLDPTLSMSWNSCAILLVDGWEALPCYRKSHEVP